MKQGVFLDGVPQSLRFSTMATALKRQGATGTLAELEKLRAEHGSRCPTHGELVDPIVATMKDEVAFICPWCSSPEILAAWEAEGMRS